MIETIASHGAMTELMETREKDIKEAMDLFPCLKKIIGKDGFNLTGKLVSRKDLDRFHLSAKEAADFSEFMNVVCIIPANYKTIGCYVVDTYGFIDWNKLPEKHRHTNHASGIGNCLCTHLIEEVAEMDNPVLENLKTAYALSIEYRRYIDTGKFELREYSHGNAGRMEYVRRKIK